MNLNQNHPAHPSIGAMPKYVIQVSIKANIITIMRANGQSLEEKQRKSEREKNDEIRNIIRDFKKKRKSLEETIDLLGSGF